MSVKKILWAAVFFLFSCGSKSVMPGDVLKPVKMQAVLFDIIRADNFVFQYVTKDSSKKPEAELAKLQQQIFAVHKISRADYNKSYEYYKAHPDIMEPMLDSLINITTRDKYKNTMGRSKPLKDSLKVE